MAPTDCEISEGLFQATLCDMDAMNLGTTLRVFYSSHLSPGPGRNLIGPSVVLILMQNTSYPNIQDSTGLFISLVYTNPQCFASYVHLSLQHPINQTFVWTNLTCHSGSKWAWHVNTLSHLQAPPFLSETILGGFMHRHAPTAHCLNSLASRNLKHSSAIVL